MTSSPDLRQWVRAVPDFPKPGILFRDLTPMLRDPRGLAAMVAQLTPVCERLQPELIVGIESRGFIIGSALAAAQGLGFVPVRKPGKLPGAVTGVDYELEYGSDRLEIHTESLNRVTTSASVVNEGDELITTVRTSFVTPGSTLYYDLSGEGIDRDDFASGELQGEAILDSDGQLSFSHILARDGVIEGQETLAIRVFLDAGRSIQLGETAYVRINDTSQGPDCRGHRVLVVDDLLATGGTAAAAAELIRVVGGELCGFAFVIELGALQGRDKLPEGVPVESLIHY